MGAVWARGRCGKIKLGAILAQIYLRGGCQAVSGGCLYKKPKILIFDEATSHLDLMTEKFINNSIKKLNVTRIIVAHRPESILSVDHIFSLELDCLREVDRNDFMQALEKHKIEQVN